MAQTKKNQNVVIRIIVPILMMTVLLLSSCASDSDTAEINETKSYTIEYNKDMDDGEVKVLWGPDLFEDFNIDNKQLALVSAGLLAAAGQDGSEEHSNDYYITKAYKTLGFEEDNIVLFNYPQSKESNVEHVSVTDDITVNQLLKETKETVKGEFNNEHCFAIGDIVMSINGEDNYVIVVTMRGTESKAESIGDNYAKPNREFYNKYVYNYFEDYSDKVFKGLAYYIDRHPYLKNKPAKVLIGGHSLGGAAANLVGARFDYCIEDQGGDWKDLPWSNGGPEEREDIAVFTFGALNVFGENGSDDTRGDKFDNICNIFNYYDTFGPNGDGFEGIEISKEFEVMGQKFKRGFVIAKGTKPAGGDVTFKRKFGKTVPFICDYTEEFEKGQNLYKNHNMPGYIRAVQRGIENENGIVMQVAKRAYLNKLGYSIDNDLFVPTSTKIKFDEITELDRAEGVYIYVADQSWNTYHDWRVHTPDAEMEEGPFNDISLKHLNHVEKRLYGDNAEGTTEKIFEEDGWHKYTANKNGDCGYFDTYYEAGVPEISFGRGGNYEWQDYDIKREDGKMTIYAGVWWMKDPELGQENVGNARIHMKKADLGKNSRYVIDSIDVEITDDGYPIMLDENKRGYEAKLDSTHEFILYGDPNNTTDNFSYRIFEYSGNEEDDNDEPPKLLVSGDLPEYTLLRCVGKYNDLFYFNEEEGWFGAKALYTYKIGDTSLKKVADNVSLDLFEESKNEIYGGIIKGKYIIGHREYPTDASDGFGELVLLNLDNNKFSDLGYVQHYIKDDDNLTWMSIEPHLQEGVENYEVSVNSYDFKNDKVNVLKSYKVNLPDIVYGGGVISEGEVKITYTDKSSEVSGETKEWKERY